MRRLTGRISMLASALVLPAVLGCSGSTYEYQPRDEELTEAQKEESASEARTETLVSWISERLPFFGEAAAPAPMAKEIRQPTNQSEVSDAGPLPPHLLGESLLRYARDNRDPTALLAAVSILQDIEPLDSGQAKRLHAELGLVEFMPKPEALVESLEKIKARLQAQLAAHTTELDDANPTPPSATDPPSAADSSPAVPSLSDVQLAEQVWSFGCSRNHQLAMTASMFMYVNDRPSPDELSDASLVGDICAGKGNQAATLNELLGLERVAPAPSDPGRIDEIDSSELTTLADFARGKLQERKEQLEAEGKYIKDWPTFLGPTRNGKTPERILTEWPESGPPFLWQRELGPGFGACSISNGRLFVFDRMEAKRRLTCLDARTGDPRWEFTYDAPWDAPGGYLGPRCTPVVDDDRVYIYDESGLLHCVCVKEMEVDGVVKAPGSELWSVDTAKEFNVLPSRYGVSSTPLVEGDLLIVVVGGSTAPSASGGPNQAGEAVPNGSGIVAFDKMRGLGGSDGKAKYKIGKYLASYSSPQIIRGERATGVALFREGLVAFGPFTGAVEPIVGATFEWRASDSRAVNAATPVVEGDEIFISTAYGKGGAVVKLESGTLKPIWSGAANDVMGLDAHFSTPVNQTGYLYGCSGSESTTAELRCIEWKTGELKWKQGDLGRVSLVCADSERQGYLICLTENGELLLVKADPTKFEKLAHIHQISEKPVAKGFTQPPLLNYPCWTAPVLSHGLLYLRGPDRLVCLDLTPSETLDD